METKERVLFGRSDVQNRQSKEKENKGMCVVVMGEKMYKQMSLEMYCVSKRDRIGNKDNGEEGRDRRKDTEGRKVEEGREQREGNKEVVKHEKGGNKQKEPDDDIEEEAEGDENGWGNKQARQDRSARSAGQKAVDVLSLQNTKQFVRWRNNKGTPNQSGPGPEAVGHKHRELKRVLLQKAKDLKRKEKQRLCPRMLDQKPSECELVPRRQANKLAHMRQDIRELTSGETYMSEDNEGEDEPCPDRSWSMNSLIDVGDHRALSCYKTDILEHLKSLEVCFANYPE